jgi:hypothetical protein
MFVALVVANLLHGESAPGHRLLEWNAAVRVLPEEITRSRNHPAVLVAGSPAWSPGWTMSIN